MKVKILMPGTRLFFVWVAVSAAFFTFSGRLASAQQKEVVWSADEKPIADQIHGLRGLADDVRVGTTKDLALKIRKLPAGANKLRLAVGLAGLSTEGDFGHATLQEVATTLAETLRESPLPWAEAKDSEANGKAAARVPADPYIELATLVRYEHVDASLNDNDDGQFRAAMAQLEADDRKREHPEFTLKDLSGKSWTFSDLRGKVVLVNFWATWCPPCRKEMPDLEALYERFGSKGLVVLGISDEEAAKVEPFIRERKVSFPVLLDPGRKVNDSFVVAGIPKSFVYDRDGKLVAQSIDMRTQKQFLEMLGNAGLK
ncbi:MAG TPA: TlpA disulfide reductase family protein [Terriglobales bacterium]|jgi:peroxiredoxin|nr:TlpA disulfide reductase family protein [Terriglobales bacterium]